MTKVRRARIAPDLVPRAKPGASSRPNADLDRAFEEIAKWEPKYKKPAVYPDGWLDAARGNSADGLSRWRRWVERNVKKP